MAKKIRNEQELMSLLGEAGKYILNNSARNAKSILQDSVQEKLYDAYTPEDYKRTNEFINSITIKDIETSGASGFRQVIDFDPDKLTPEDRGSGHWNAHMSMNKDKFTKQLVETLNDGSNGGLFNHEGAHFIEDALAKVRTSLDNDDLSAKIKEHVTSYSSESDIPDYRVPSGLVIRKTK